MKIVDLIADDEGRVTEVAQLLMEGCKIIAPNAWPDLEIALVEVCASFASDRISRVMVDDLGNVLGWIGGISQYDGHAWELHPLVVASSHRCQGIGRKLVEDLEAQVRQRGGITIYLGSDDEANLTSISGIDLFPDPLQHLREIQNLRGHPYEFYLKVGFKVVGVIPDANGFGKPDIILAKGVRRLSSVNSSLIERD